MSAARVWLRAVGVGCLSLAAWGCNETEDAASITGVPPSTPSLAAAPSEVPVDNVTPINATNTITKPVVIGGANQPPVGRYTVTCWPGKCVLDASSSTDDHGIVSYRWTASVGTRQAKTGVTITRKWLARGGNTYQETLTVTDGGGLTNSLQRTITIPPP